MIFFDDRCNLCDRTVKALAACDLFHRLEFKPLSQNVELARRHGVSEHEALTDLVGVSPGGQFFAGTGSMCGSAPQFSSRCRYGRCW